MKQFKALDAYCKAGGATKGLQRAGFYVVGVDIEDQKHYCGDLFAQGDALEFIRKYGREFDFTWASPPCQHYSSMRPFSTRWGKQHPDLVAATREALRGHPCWAIENVFNAPLLHAFMLCGLSFGLKTYRHRFFETNFMALGPSHLPHDPKAIRERRIFSCIGHPGGRSARDNLHFGSTDDWREAMDIDWMNGCELAQAIPPAYSEFIGKQAIQYLESQVA